MPLPSQPRAACHTSATAIGGRLLIVSAALLYVAFAIFVSQQSRAEFLHSFGLARSPVRYLDLKSISAALQCAEKGIDPLISNPCDPDKRTFNYPRIWLHQPPLLRTLFHSHPEHLALAMIAMFLLAAVCCFPRLSLPDAAIAAVALLSPAVAFAIDRGNTDLFIFALIVAAVWTVQGNSLLRSTLGYASLLFSIALKLYPAAAIILVARERPRRRIVLGGALLIIASVYIGATLPDILRNLRSSPDDVVVTYSSRQAGLILDDFLSSIAIRLPGLVRALQLSVSLSALAMAWIFIHKQPAVLRFAESLSQIQLDMLRVGGAIYCVTYVIVSSYSYRLIFLLLVLPALLQLRRCPAPTVRAFGTFGVLLALASLWSTFSWTPVRAVAMLSHWLLFAFFCVCFAAMAPQRLVNAFRRRTAFG